MASVDVHMSQDVATSMPSLLVIPCHLSAWSGKMEPFTDHPDRLKNEASVKANLNLWQWCMHSLLLYLLNGSKRENLKLCAYKTSLSKSDRNYLYFVNPQCLNIVQHLHCNML